MLKLMKYEFRKTRTTLLVMLAALVVLEAGFLVGYARDSYRLTGICLGLLTALVFAVYTYILIAGIVSYNRELNDKTGYMVFMAPVGPWGIVASKLLFTIVAALAVTALFGAAAYLDYSMVFKKIEGGGNLYQQLDFTFTMFTGSMGDQITLTKLILIVAFEVGTVLISVILTMCTAFLAITLSATLLQNKKGFLRMLVSVVLFFALNYVTSRVSGLLVRDAVPADTGELFGMLGAHAGVEFAFAALFAWLSALLLDRKVSL